MFVNKFFFFEQFKVILIIEYLFFDRGLFKFKKQIKVYFFDLNIHADISKFIQKYCFQL